MLRGNTTSQHLSLSLLAGECTHMYTHVHTLASISDTIKPFQPYAQCAKSDNRATNPEIVRQVTWERERERERECVCVCVCDTAIPVM
jgi:hypothetical protein